MVSLLIFFPSPPMQIKFLISLLCLAYAFSSSGQSADWFTVKAFLPNRNGSVVELKVDGQVVDKGLVANDIYSFVSSATKIHHGLFQIRKENNIVELPLYVEKGTIKIIDKGHNRLSASGTVTNDAYLKLIYHITRTAQLRFGYDYKKIKEYTTQLCIKFIRDNPESLLSLQLLKYYPFLKDAADPLYASLFNSLDESVKNTYLGRQMYNSLQVERSTGIGVVMPNIYLPDTSNQMSTLYEPGKFTFIDFWASWCTPCRQQNPELVKLYNQYSDKGFSVVSVSLDNNKQNWMNAIKKDKLSWRHLSDLNGWESAAVKSFYITAVPMNFLVDTNGIIVAKNLHTTNLKTILERQFQ
jgi:thiol-disulfide isomerase/thioredoxin